jgi:hypothetical protein
MLSRLKTSTKYPRGENVFFIFPQKWPANLPNPKLKFPLFLTSLAEAYNEKLHNILMKMSLITLNTLFYIPPQCSLLWEICCAHKNENNFRFSLSPRIGLPFRPYSP